MTTARTLIVGVLAVAIFLAMSLAIAILAQYIAASLVIGFLCWLLLSKDEPTGTKTTKETDSRDSS